MDNGHLLISYLREKGKSKTTIATYVHVYQKFKEWTAQNQVDSEYANHTDLLDYIGHLRKQNLTQSSIQGYLAALSHYFEALIKAGTITQNPARYITLKVPNTKTLHTILSREQLEKLYTDFDVKGKRKTKTSAYASAMRNKIAVGLMVFQGLDITTLSKLTVEDINVLNGTVNVKASRTCAARVLSLQAVQIIEIDRYISQARKELQDCFSRGESELLLITGYDRYTYANRRLMQRLRKQESALKTADQVRASVIAHWLKQYNLREAQYMAGHRQIHSTEAYQRNDTEGLQMDIDRFHPMNEQENE